MITGTRCVNSRVLEWIFNRCKGTAEAVATPIGNLPTLDALNLDGLNLSDEARAELLQVDVDGWLKEIPRIHEYYDKFGDRLPQALRHEVEELESRLKDETDVYCRCCLSQAICSASASR